MLVVELAHVDEQLVAGQSFYLGTPDALAQANRDFFVLHDWRLWARILRFA